MDSRRGGHKDQLGTQVDMSPQQSDRKNAALRAQVRLLQILAELVADDLRQRPR
jgi:hypothetical protein